MGHFEITITNCDKLTVSHIKTQGTISALIAALVSVGLSEGLTWDKCYEMTMNHDVSNVWEIKAAYCDREATTRYHLKAVEIE